MDKTELFAAAFCGNSFETQVAARANLKAGDEAVVMTLRGRGALVSTVTVTHATAKFLVVNGVKYHRHNGKQVRARRSASVSVFLYALTPEVRAWREASGD